MRCAGIVILFNPEDDIIRNIMSYVYCLDKLYIVDNSEIETQIENKINGLNLGDKIEYFSLKVNKGLSYALNLGVQKAIDEGFDWLLTMDQDSLFENNVVEIYKKYINSHDCTRIAVLAPQYDTERSEIVRNNNVEEVYWTMQSANFINLKVLESIGEFEEKYFIDCIDYEFCLRAHKQNFIILRCNEAILKHSPAINKKVYIWGKELNYGYTSPLRIYYQVRNAFDMWKKYRELKALGIIFVKLGKVIFLFDNKRAYFRAICEGIRDCNNNQFGKKRG